MLQVCRGSGSSPNISPISMQNMQNVGISQNVTAFWGSGDARSLNGKDSVLWMQSGGHWAEAVPVQKPPSAEPEPSICRAEIWHGDEPPATGRGAGGEWRSPKISQEFPRHVEKASQPQQARGANRTRRCAWENFRKARTAIICIGLLIHLRIMRLVLERSASLAYVSGL